MMKKASKFSPEVINQAVRLVCERRSEHSSQWATIVSIAGTIGCTAQTLRRWVRRSECDKVPRGVRHTAEQERVKALEREVCDLCKANQVLRLAGAVYAQAELERHIKSFRN